MKVVTVLRSGGDFGPEHVYAIRRQLNEHLPDHEFLCLTDVVSIPYRVPLQHDLPGWWSKMEMCRPDITGPILYLDLDTVIVGDLSELVADRTQSICLRDFYRGHANNYALQSSVMLLTETDRKRVWDWWLFTGPERVMERYQRGGDQYVFQWVLASQCLYWQDTHPGAVVGYKTDMKGMDEPPPGAKVVVFHGEPRPWETQHEWAWNG